jgi:hypothetical protein
MNKKIFIISLTIINGSPLLSMSASRIRRTETATSLLDGDLRLLKERLEQFETLDFHLKHQAQRNLRRIKGDISFNYELFNKNDPLLTEVIGCYNALVARFRDEGQANDSDFFWEPAEPAFVPKQAATIEELDESDLSQPTQHAPNNSTLLIAAPNNQRNQRLYSAIKYSIIGGGLTAFTVILKLYRWIKTKRDTQAERADLQLTTTKTESLERFPKPKTS